MGVGRGNLVPLRRPGHSRVWPDAASHDNSRIEPAQSARDLKLVIARAGGPIMQQIEAQKIGRE